MLNTYSDQKDDYTSTWRELLLLSALVFLLFSIGTLGFMLIEGWNLIDALFMTVITLSTVGYQEVHPLSQHGQIFAMLLIIAGVGAAAYAFAVISRAVVEGELNRIRTYRKMHKQIAGLKKHTIVCGFGRLGETVAAALADSGQDVVVVDRTPEIVEASGSTRLLQVTGTAFDDEALLAAGIERAKHLLTLLPSDAENVYTVLCARDLNSKLNIIARCEAESTEKRLLRAGANQIVAPFRVSGARMVQQILRPHVSDFLELAVSKKGEQLALEEVVVPSNSPIEGKTLQDSAIRDKTGVIIAALIGTDGNFAFNPNRESIIEPGSTMIVLGESKSLEKLSSLLES